MSTHATVEAVCIVHRVRPGAFHDTAIDKRPVRGRVEVTEEGLAGDRQLDSSHGGVDAAVYVYAAEDAAHWAEVLGRKVPPGWFGDNVRTTDLDVTGAEIGEQWRVGEVLLEVRQPRTPCENLALRVGVEGFHLDFNASGRVGAKCRVLEAGSIAAGDDVEVVLRPGHGVTVGDCSGRLDKAQGRALLDSGIPLRSSIRAKARRAAERR